VFSSLINNTDGTLVSVIQSYFIQHRASLVVCLTFLRQGFLCRCGAIRMHTSDVEGAFSWLFHLKASQADLDCA
jgi:hypothetical protein